MNSNNNTNKIRLLRILMFIFFSLALVVSSLKAQTKPWVSAYYAGWMQGQNNDGYLTSQNIDYSAVTQVIHFALVPNSDGSLDSTSNSVTPANSSALIANAHAAGVKVIISVGGWNSESSYMGATSPANLSKFVNNLVSFMKYRGYDGIDIDWETLSATDAVQYTAFITLLRSALDQISPRPLLTAATQWQPAIFAAIYSKFDEINLMSYDMSGAWTGWVTWHNSPVYNGGITFPSTGALVPSINDMVSSFSLAGIPVSKLGIGIDFYGYVWSGGTGTPTGGVTAPDQSWSTAPTVQANVPYYTIMQQYYQQSRYHWDSGAQASYLSIDNSGSANDQFISYDDTATCSAKVNYVKSNGLGGLIVWELGAGYQSTNPAGQQQLLLESIKNAINGGSTPIVTVKDTTAPTVAVTSPANSATISGTISITANASDNVGVKSLTFKVDGTQQGSSLTASPYSVSLNTTALSNGTHTISATASDAAGNASTSSVSVTVSNTIAVSNSSDDYAYQDNLSSSWTNISWSITPNFTSTKIVYAGSYSLNVQQNAWGALRLLSGSWAAPQEIDPANYNSLQFAVYGESANLNLNIYAENTSKGSFPTVSYGLVPANQWTIVSIPIKTLDPNNLSIDQIVIQDVNGTAVTYDLDNIKFSGNSTVAASAPALLSPSNNQTAVSLSPTLSWNAVTGAASYNVQVATDQAFTNIYLNKTGVTSSSLALSGLTNGSTYFWKVASVNSAGSAAWSPIWSFTSGSTPTTSASLAVYNDGLVSPWINTSWSASINFASTQYVYQGSSSAQVVQSAWGSLSLHDGSWGSNNSVSTLSYNALQFAVYSTTSLSLSVMFENDGGSSFPKINYGSVPANVWTVVTIPLSQLNPNNSAIQRIDIMEMSGTQKTYYVDNLSFVNSTLAKQLADNNNSLTMPNEFSLRQNYPNPFNPTTTIEFSIAASSHVSLDVYNILGEKVATLVNDNLNAGQHSIVFNASSHLASGIYIYQLRAGNMVVEKKMTLLK